MLYIERYHPDSLDLIQDNLATAQKNILSYIGDETNQRKINKFLKDEMNVAFDNVDEDVIRDVVILKWHSKGLLGSAGMIWGIGNRETTPETAPWIGRADRASRNMLENLGPFTILVLVAHVSGLTNATTATACQVFLAARIAHGVVYVAGIPWLRTLAFFVGMIAEVVILIQLL